MDMNNIGGDVYGNAAVTATPVSGGAGPAVGTVGNVSPVSPELQEALRQTAEAVQSSLEGFSDTVPEGSCGDSTVQQPSEEQVKKSVSFFQKFQEYIGSKGFCDNVNMTARKYGVPPKKVAEGFFGKVFGTLGDIAGIAIGTVGNLAHSVIDIISAIMHGGVNMVVSAASALARILTFNKTCLVCA